MSPGEWAGLISAITGGVTAILAAIGGLIVQLRRISPTERHDAAAQASSTDEAQDQRLQELEAELRRIRGEDSPS